jgi:hypothetical protein
VVEEVSMFYADFITNVNRGVGVVNNVQTLDNVVKERTLLIPFFKLWFSSNMKGGQKLASFATASSCEIMLQLLTVFYYIDYS